jgi:hypothetical protein
VLLAAATAAAKTLEGAGALVLAGTPEGAEVFVDGEKVGTLPLPGPLSLTAGDHTIKIQKGGFAPLIDVFSVKRKAQTKLDVELVPVAGVVRVRSNVDQAHVFVDGKFACEAPCSAEVAPGQHAIKVSHGGYKDMTENVASVAGQEVALEVKLEELPMGLNPYKPPPPPPPKWYEKWWVWTSGVLVLGAVAVIVAVPLVETNKDPVKDFHPSYTFTLGH